MTLARTGSPSLACRRCVPRRAASLLIALCASGGALAQDAVPPVGPGEVERTPAAPADPLERFEGRPVREVRFVGLEDQETIGLVENQTRLRAGQPLSVRTVREDIRRLNRLGRFRSIQAAIEPYDDGGVALIYTFAETPVIVDVAVVGNRQVNDDRIFAVIPMIPGTPVDRFELDRAIRLIRDLYRDRGYFLADVTVDEEELAETGIVLFRIREGERLRVTDIRFEGNEAIESRRLRGAVQTKEAGLFQKAPLDEDQLDADVAAIVKFYQDRGYLDVRADREVRFSPNGREAIVTFLVDEGPRYTLRSVRAELAEGNSQPSGQEPTVYSTEQIRALIPVKPGDVYSISRLDESEQAVRDAYGKLGFADVRVRRFELRDTTSPEVDLLLVIEEGEPFKTGIVTIKGNDLTRQKVINRQVFLRPDRPLDVTEIEDSERRLEVQRIFAPGSPKITILPEDESNPGYRDVLVEVEETNTASLGFGAAVDTDLGLVGTIQLNQSNFDITDTPDSFGEFFSGRAFRGGGQTFNITLAPGTEVQTYSIGLSDPYLFESKFSGSIQGFYRDREFSDYDEQRYGTRLGFGRRLGERWVLNLNTRFESVALSDIDEDAPVDVYAVEDQNILDGIGLSLTRTTADNRFRPTRGSRTLLSIEQVGLIANDFDFTKFRGEHTLFLPVREDFYGRATVLSLRTAVDYTPQSVDDVPVYERYYLGGRSFRGFEFRGVSPRGIRNDTMMPGDDPVGGTWAFFAGAELEQPVFDEIIAVVAFIDTGTVTDDPGFEDYRVSVGLGVRLYIEQLSPAPLAFDFGFPLIYEDEDDQRLFSFSIDLPF